MRSTLRLLPSDSTTTHVVVVHARASPVIDALAPLGELVANVVVVVEVDVVLEVDVVDVVVAVVSAVDAEREVSVQVGAPLVSDAEASWALSDELVNRTVQLPFATQLIALIPSVVVPSVSGVKPPDSLENCHNSGVTFDSPLTKQPPVKQEMALKESSAPRGAVIERQ